MNRRYLARRFENMYTKTVGHSLHWFDSHLSGEISSKIADFQSNITVMIKSCFNALNNVSTMIISILFLIQVNVLSALVIFVFVIIYMPILMLLLKKQLRLRDAYVTSKQETLGIINDSITNIFGIKIIGNVWAELKTKLIPAIAKWRGKDKKAREFDAYFVDNADTLLVTVMGAVQIYLTAYLYQSGQITAGGFAFISMITLSIHAEIDYFLDNLLFNINPAVASMKASYAFINAPQDTYDRMDAKTLGAVHGDIIFDKVSFAYGGNPNEVLHQLSFHINAGDKIGIVGASGAGKTTIIKCLLRYFDIKSGKILIDNQDISHIASVFTCKYVGDTQRRYFHVSPLNC